MACNDARFASQKDLLNQGGYLISMVHQSVCRGETSHFLLVDWRSWKLPRIARTSSAAESQASSECTDVVIFECVCWEFFWIPKIPLDDNDEKFLGTQLMQVKNSMQAGWWSQLHTGQKKRVKELVESCRHVTISMRLSQCMLDMVAK